MASKKKEKPRKLETQDWEVYVTQGELIGRGRGRELAQKYIAALEASWGGPPDTPEGFAVACRWIEEKALEEAFTSPGWNSMQLASLRYKPNTPEWRALDARIWRAFQTSIVRTVRLILTKYGCGNLRFLDMAAFVRYYRGEEK